MSDTAGSDGKKEKTGCKAPPRKKPKCLNAYPEMLTAATILTVGLTEGRSDQEVETLINFIHLLDQNLHYVLTQRMIDRKAQEELEINLS